MYYVLLFIWNFFDDHSLEILKFDFRIFNWCWSRRCRLETLQNIGRWKDQPPIQFVDFHSVIFLKIFHLLITISWWLVIRLPWPLFRQETTLGMPKPFPRLQLDNTAVQDHVEHLKSEKNFSVFFVDIFFVSSK